MMDPACIATLKNVHSREASGFLRYLVNVSSSPVQDQADRDANRLIRELSNEAEANLEDLASLISENGESTDRASFPMSFTNYNFLRPRYLLRPLVERFIPQEEDVRQQLEALERSSTGGLDPKLRQVIDNVLDRNRRIRGRAEDAANAIPSPEAGVATARPKGTSASRW
jgi:hypothetical protein